VNGTLAILTAPCEETPSGRELLRPYFGMHRFQREESEAVEFHLGYSDWIRLLRSSGLEVVDHAELQAPESEPEHRYPGLPERWWAQWTSEQLWRVRKR
jgi:hypothetical protein